MNGIFGKFATVGGATLASRVLGFVREVMIAAALGAGPVADAFYAAFRFPNLFRRLLGEGAFNTAFIPLFSKRLEAEGKDGAEVFARDVLSVLAFILFVLTVLALIAMPFLTSTVIAPGFLGDPEKFENTVFLSRLMFPYLAMMSLVAMFSGILNGFRAYFLAAFAPVLLNVAFIIALSLGFITGADQKTVGYLLAGGVIFGGLLQLGTLYHGLRKIEFRLTLGLPKLTPEVKHLLVLAAPAAAAGGITQINLFVGQIIASTQSGAISVLQYADRLYQLPLGVVGIAIGVVLLPELSRALKAENSKDAKNLQNRSMEFGLLLTLPAAVALFVLAAPIVTLLFERGAFGAETSAITAQCVSVFALGLPAFVLIKILSPAFFARENTKTPMWFAGANTLVTVLFSLWLFPLYGPAGIAAATSIGGWVNAGLLFIALYRGGEWRPDRRLITRLLLMLASALVMGIGLIVLLSYSGSLVPAMVGGRGASFLIESGITLFLLLCGAVIFAVMVLATGAMPLRDVKAAFLKR